MHATVSCGSCSNKLTVQTEHMGKQIRCPRSQKTVRVAVAPVIVGPVAKATPVTPVIVQAANGYATGTPVTPVVVRAVAATPRAVSPPSRPPAPAADFVVIPEEAPDPAPPALSEPPKLSLKKKKKKRKAMQETTVPAWMWIAGGIGALVTIVGIIFGVWMALKMRAGGGSVNWPLFMVAFGISCFVSLVILIISMFLSSALGGGINFGDAKTAIIGAIFLIVIVNLVALIPYVGRYLTFVVWLVGFMTIYGLDPWEARFLLIINWILNYLFATFILGILLKDRGQLEIDDDGMEDNEVEVQDGFEPPDHNGIQMPKRPVPNDKDQPRNGKSPRKVPDRMDEEDDSFGYRGELHERMCAWVRQQTAGRMVLC
jgi:hypothetical protein